MARTKVEWVAQVSLETPLSPMPPERLQKVFVLQRKPQERIGALAIEVKFAAHAGAVVFDSSVVNGKFGPDFFAGFALGDQTHDTELGRREIAGQCMA
jgi:hypothetical protein